MPIGMMIRMSKPTLLYASPFPPLESGIADHSAALVRGLAEYFDVTLYTDDYDISDVELRTHFRVRRHGVDQIQWDAYDHRLYHIGNNPWYHGNIYQTCLQHPDTVVLHETVLYFLVVGVYQNRAEFYRQLFEIGGPEAIATVKSALKEGKVPLQCSRPEDAPLNRELLCSGNRFIVHSAYARDIIESTAYGTPVRTIPLARERLAKPLDFDRSKFLESVELPPKATIITSLGFVAPTKMNDAVCRAVCRYNESHVEKLYYVMAGAGEFVAQYLNEYIRVTGYLSQHEFEAYLHATDLVLNLRYPTMGETSLALLDAMWAEKPCIVSDLGWFAELPDDVVLKLDVRRPELMHEQVYEALCLFTLNRQAFRQAGIAARAYVEREHSVENAAKTVFNILRRDRDFRANSGSRAV
jgi:glycosyltransferase involved in cell wall biosynthesis